MGQNIIAVDDSSEIPLQYYTDIRRDDGSSFLKKEGTKNDVLFVSWPRYMQDWLHHFQGNTIIFIGEIEGCTDCIEYNDSQFHIQDSSQLKKHWTLTLTHPLPRWDCMKDVLHVYKRVL